MGRTFFLILLFILIAGSAFAGARRFTYVYEATTFAPGGVEFENWITWSTSKPNDRAFDRVDFRHELEFGITERFQAAVYVADWNYESGVRYSASALELTYNLSNPVADTLGLSIYQEFRIGRRFVESESKLIAQKNFGRFVAAYNATLEAIWEGRGLEDREGEFQQSLGLSYEINPRLLFGAECVHEIAFPDWEKTERGVFFAGPNISVRAGRWWTTVTALAQLTRVGEEPDLQLRTIVGFAF